MLSTPCVCWAGCVPRIQPPPPPPAASAQRYTPPCVALMARPTPTPAMRTAGGEVLPVLGSALVNPVSALLTGTLSAALRGGLSPTCAMHDVPMPSGLVMGSVHVLK